MDEKKIKKFPVVRYLCYLLAVSILFTSVTFSRYVGSTSGDTSALLSRFVCSYEIGDMSAATFSNANYWLTLNNESIAMNTARSVRFTVRNHTLLEDGSADRISDVDLRAALRLYAPAEFAENLAVQVVEVDENGSYITKTPQYVLKEFIYDGNNAFASHNGEKIDTADFDDFESRNDSQGNPVDEELEVSGGFTGTEEAHTGTISAYCAETKNSLTITAAMREATYSVGFSRNVVGDQGQTAPMLYLDCKRKMPFYTIDLSLPEMSFAAGTAQQRTFVLFLTIVSKTENEDFSSKWTEDMDGLLTAPKAGEPNKMFNGAVVTGYHFEQKAEVYTLATDGSIVPMAEPSQTTIRIQRTYDYENGGAIMSYYHVAPLSEGAASVVHPIEDFYEKSGAPVEVGFSDVAQVHSYWGLCSNEGASGHIYFSDIPDNPFYRTYSDQTAFDAKTYYAIGEVLSKGYSTSLNVLFVQASESLHES